MEKTIEFEIILTDNERGIIDESFFALKQISGAKTIDKQSKEKFYSLLRIFAIADLSSKNEVNEVSSIRLDLSEIKALRDLVKEYTSESTEKSHLLYRLEETTLINIAHLRNCLSLSVS